MINITDLLPLSLYNQTKTQVLGARLNVLIIYLLTRNMCGRSCLSSVGVETVVLVSGHPTLRDNEAHSFDKNAAAGEDGLSVRHGCGMHTIRAAKVNSALTSDDDVVNAD